MHKTKFALKYIFLVLILGSINIGHACTTIIVGKDTTHEGKTLIARTSDTIDARRAKNLKIYYDKDATKSYIGLPYWDLQDDKENDMSQVTTNAYGLSLSATQTIRSNPYVLSLDPPTDLENGVAEPNIPHLIMTQATSALEGVNLLGAAIEAKGVASKKGFGVLFADSKEAWYLETLSGHQWVAVKIPENAYFAAANGPGQIQEYAPEKHQYLFSHYKGQTPLEFAQQNNIARTNNQAQFDFRKTFGDIANSINPRVNYVRVAYIQHLLNPDTQKFDLSTVNNGTYPMFLTPKYKISVDSIKNVLGSHYAEYNDIDPLRIYDKDKHPKILYRSIAHLNTSNAHVTLVNNSVNDSDPNINNLEYIALGMPTISFYLPIYYGITEVPQALKGATNKANLDDENIFWQFRKLQALVFLNDADKNIEYTPIKFEMFIKDAMDQLAKEVEAARLEMESNYRITRNRALINQFTNNTVDKLSALNIQLIKSLMQTLDINNKYGLKTKQELSDWFTHKVREQECNFKPTHCTY